jgi:hypothetical protein
MTNCTAGPELGVCVVSRKRRCGGCSDADQSFEMGLSPAEGCKRRRFRTAKVSSSRLEVGGVVGVCGTQKVHHNNSDPMVHGPVATQQPANMLSRGIKMRSDLAEAAHKDLRRHCQLPPLAMDDVLAAIGVILLVLEGCTHAASEMHMDTRSSRPCNCCRSAQLCWHCGPSGAREAPSVVMCSIPKDLAALGMLPHCRDALQRHHALCVYKSATSCLTPCPGDAPVSPPPTAM